MKTIKSASVKVMRSYDYCHFEVAMSIENGKGVTTKDVDDLRKQAQRLADKAVGQYQKAKQEAAHRNDSEYRMQNFSAEASRIKSKPEMERTVREVAHLKQYENENWREQFNHEYDYDDDDNYNI